jgi:hypothetical protein
MSTFSFEESLGRFREGDVPGAVETFVDDAPELDAAGFVDFLCFGGVSAAPLLAKGAQTRAMAQTLVPR